MQGLPRLVARLSAGVARRLFRRLRVGRRRQRSLAGGLGLLARGRGAALAGGGGLTSAGSGVGGLRPNMVRPGYGSGAPRAEPPAVPVGVARFGPCDGGVCGSCPGCRGPRHGGRRHSGLRAGHDDRRGSGVILGPASAHVDASRGPRHDRRRGADHRVRDGPRPPRAVIAKVSVDGREVLTRAFGESMTGVPATTDMHVRNGAVAISYVSTFSCGSSTRAGSASTTGSPPGSRRSRTPTRSPSASSRR